ncbi:MAG: hypothetical protein NZ552_09010 [Planctomycetes bacterium]|nr:hypothetical protein [Planctomycetota bacterium]
MQHLDAKLVEHLHALHRQRATGLLLASTIDSTIGICLVEGEVLAVDIGSAIDAAFLEMCLVHHKIDAQAQAEAQAALAAGQPVRAWLLERQLISEAEVEQMLYAVAEDALMRALCGPCLNRVFHPGVLPEQMALDRTALRTRIGVEPLIRGAAQSIQERLAVATEVGGPDAVFALAEGGEAVQLSDYEKLVLNFIDGKTTLGQIAIACRDSDANLGRVFRALLAKRVVQRVRLGSAPQRAAATAAAPAARGAAPAPTAPREASAVRRWVRSGLVALLLLAVAIAALVVDYERRRSRLAEDERAVLALISARSWAAAQEAVARLRHEAGNDLAALRQVDALAQAVETGMLQERQRIARLIDEGAWDEARRALAALPDAEDLQQRLQAEESEERAAAQALADAVRTRLNGNDVVGALALLDGQEERRSRLARALVAAWRERTWQQLQDPAQPMPARLAALAALRLARPDEALSWQLVAFEQRLSGQLEELVAALRRCQEQARSGAYEEAERELAGLLAQPVQVAAVDEARAEALVAIARVRADAEAVRAQALAALADPQGDLVAAQRELERLVQRYPQLSGGERWQRLQAAIAACQDSGALAERAAAAEQAAQQAQDMPELAAALQQRATALHERERQARRALETARFHARRGEWTAAQAMIDDLITEPLFRDTAARLEALAEREAIRQAVQRQQQLRARLLQAVSADDIAQALAIGRELGLERLPLVVLSVPAGAEVVRSDGTVLGTTPLVLDLPADARAELVLSVRAPGYREATLRGERADGGWRLFARLQRQPLLALRLPHPLTATPAVVDGRLWLADHARAVVLAEPQPAALRTYPFPAALPTPPTAPARALADGAVLLTTRDGMALRIAEERVERLPLVAGSEFAVLVQRSEYILDRELWIVADGEGRLRAGRRGSAQALWQTAPGAPWACAPLQASDQRLVTVRRDGRAESWSPDDGRLLAAAQTGEPVIAAWHEGAAIVGVGARQRWRWDGRELERQPLAAPCIAAGPGALITDDGEVLRLTAEGPRVLGRLELRQLAGAGVLAWGEHVVVHRGSLLDIVGPRPFRHQAEGSVLLPPVIWDGRLVAASLDGELWIWNP